MLHNAVIQLCYEPTQPIAYAVLHETGTSHNSVATPACTMQIFTVGELRDASIMF